MARSIEENRGTLTLTLSRARERGRAGSRLICSIQGLSGHRQNEACPNRGGRKRPGRKAEGPAESGTAQPQPPNMVKALPDPRCARCPIAGTSAQGWNEAGPNREKQNRREPSASGPANFRTARPKSRNMVNEWAGAPIATCPIPGLSARAQNEACPNQDSRESQGRSLPAG